MPGGSSGFAVAIAELFRVVAEACGGGAAAVARACQEIGSVPGHSTRVPDHETVIRLPAVMLKYVPRPEDGLGEVPRT